LRHPLKETLRTLAVFSLRFTPLWRAFIARVDVMLLANRDNLWIVPRQHLPRCKIRQLGWDGGVAPLPGKQCNDGTLRIFWGGRILGWKGLEILLRAVATLKSAPQKLIIDITGKGPDLAYFKRLTEKLGLADSVTFHGHIPYEKVQELQRNADVFAFTSLHETTGTALMEAMALGKACIVLAHAGPGEIASEDCSMLVPVVGGCDKTVEAFASALSKLANSPELRMTLGKRARARIEGEYSWVAYIDFICNQYRSLAEEHCRPSAALAAGSSVRSE
jgi:glycosyltransferase involved in cell wall biosynthesis